MPVVECHLIKGYSDDAKTRLCESLTDAVRLVLPAPADAVTVMVHDMEPTGYMRGRTGKVPAPALPDPKIVVRSFLKAMEARDLKAAQSYLADGFEMTFPGNQRMTTLEELVEWAAPRYRFVKKAFETFDAFQSAGESTLVYCAGTLAGEWPDGTPFDGIRFVDRFELIDGRIVRQDVWNDVAEVRESV